MFEIFKTLKWIQSYKWNQQSTFTNLYPSIFPIDYLKLLSDVFLDTLLQKKETNIVLVNTAALVPRVSTLCVSCIIGSNIVITKLWLNLTTREAIKKMSQKMEKVHVTLMSSHNNISFTMTMTHFNSSGLSYAHYLY